MNRIQYNVPEDFIHAIGGNPLVSQVLYSRGINQIESAKSSSSQRLITPLLPQNSRVWRKRSAFFISNLNEKKTIGVWGDFDVDGQTSTTLLVSALRELGGNVIYHIPVRGEESHGISLPALQKFLQRGVDLILTCDTGITSHEAIEFAKNSGVPVIVTDHHDLPDVLPRC